MGAYRRRVILVLGGLRVSILFVYIDRGQKKYIACSSKSYPVFYFILGGRYEAWNCRGLSARVAHPALHCNSTAPAECDPRPPYMERSTVAVDLPPLSPPSLGRPAVF